MSALVKQFPRRRYTVIAQWQSDWRASGRSERTAAEYVRILRSLPTTPDVITKAEARAWQSEAPTPATRRQRARALNAVMRFMSEEDLRDDTFTLKAPVEAERPQTTVTPDDVEDVLARARTPRDKALIAVLWATGMRRSEVVAMKLPHLDLENGFVIVPLAKSGKPRIAPLDQRAVSALYRWLRQREGHPYSDLDALWLSERGALTAEGLKMVLRRLEAPSAHSWRRGWAVDSLRAGVSQVSVQAAAGWSGPAMVTRYCAALSQELALDEFRAKRR
jgi:integrase/recombinase XerD